MILFATLMFWFMLGHALADFPLQGAFLSTAKRRRHSNGGGGFWVCGLSAHALIHAGAVNVAIVWALHGQGRDIALFIGAMEFIMHWGIDLLKCERIISARHDQALHLACKLVWAGLVLAMTGAKT